MEGCSYKLMYRQTDRIIYAHAQIILAVLRYYKYMGRVVLWIWAKLSYNLVQVDMG